MFQQAINDINKAIELDPQNVNYWVEKGGVCLRVNQTAEAVQALEKQSLLIRKTLQPTVC